MSSLRSDGVVSQQCLGHGPFKGAPIHWNQVGVPQAAIEPAVDEIASDAAAGGTMSARTNSLGYPGRPLNLNMLA